MSSGKPGRGGFDDEPEIEEILHIAQCDGRDLIPVPAHAAHEPFLYQPRERLTHRRLADPNLARELGFGNALARRVRAVDNALP
jgi:hypothetical protein